MTTSEYYQRRATVKANMEITGNYALDADWLKFLTDQLPGIGAQLRQNSGGIRIFWDRARGMDVNTLAREHYNGTSFFCALFTSPELQGRFTIKDFWSEIIEPGKLVNGLTQDEFYTLFTSDKLTAFIREKYKATHITPALGDNNNNSNSDEKKRIQEVFDEKALADMRVKAEQDAAKLLPTLRSDIIAKEMRKIEEEVKSPANLKRLREEATRKVTSIMEHEIETNLMQDYVRIKDRVLAKLEKEIRDEYEGPLRNKIAKQYSNSTPSNSNSEPLFRYDDEITKLHSLKAISLLVDGDTQLPISEILSIPFSENKGMVLEMPGIKEVVICNSELKYEQGANMVYHLVGCLASRVKRMKIDELIEVLKKCK